MRKLFERAGGNLAANGAVSYMFERKAVFVVDPDAEIGEDRLMEVVLEAGAEDLAHDGGAFTVQGAPGDFVAIKAALEKAEVPLVDASVTQIPGNTVAIESVDDANKVLRLLDALEDHDDVQGVSANYVLTDEVAEALAKGG